MDIAIMLFDGFEDLDALAPFNVVSRAGMRTRFVTPEPADAITSASGAVITPHGTLDKTPSWLVVPGGGLVSDAEHGVRAELRRGTIPAAVARCATAGSNIASVCTGALLVAASGMMHGRRATTHHQAFDELSNYGVDVIRDVRVVDDGDMVSAGGVTSGIDLGLWLIQRELGAKAMRAHERRLEYRLGRVAETNRATAPIESVRSLTLPTTPLVQAAYDFAKTALPAAIFNHSVRSYLFARMVADWRGWRPAENFDDELLCLSCVLHDIGLSDAADTPARDRFEVVGAMTAATFLAGEGLASPFVDVVSEAIKLHSSYTIADSHSPEAALTRTGISMDVGGGVEKVPDDVAASIHAEYPRLEMARCLVDAIVAQAADDPMAAPPYSIPGELVRERRTPPFVSRLEQRAAASRWGC